MNPLNKLQVY